MSGKKEAICSCSEDQLKLILRVPALQMWNIYQTRLNEK